ncbi:hypothetical protein DLAC_09308 [Tieghemostelium lacteum]|uniref:Sushi domain-containing protein n=1 Tax=Tieghemostelium lacteum TaxID=361077 RepID=A0A151Z9R0_TIELA|nr:hypothetical protein DLAC_09308 [Tieghemostelium lacteum]|eukprot:KYQ90672.1 hypothetical protein DLAC_09308 [Tieghemostelium lacteum]
MKTILLSLFVIINLSLVLSSSEEGTIFNNFEVFSDSKCTSEPQGIIYSGIFNLCYDFLYSVLPFNFIIKPLENVQEAQFNIFSEENGCFHKGPYNSTVYKQGGCTLEDDSNNYYFHYTQSTELPQVPPNSIEFGFYDSNSNQVGLVYYLNGTIFSIDNGGYTTQYYCDNNVPTVQYCNYVSWTGRPTCQPNEITVAKNSRDLKMIPKCI